jgi:hypothetical protein
VALAVGTAMFANRRNGTDALACVSVPNDGSEASDQKRDDMYSSSSSAHALGEQAATSASSSPQKHDSVSSSPQRRMPGPSMHRSPAAAAAAAQESDMASQLADKVSEKLNESASHMLAEALTVDMSDKVTEDMVVAGDAAGDTSMAVWWRRHDVSQWARALASGSQTIASVALSAVYKMYCVKRFSQPHGDAMHMHLHMHTTSSADGGDGWFAAASGGTSTGQSNHDDVTSSNSSSSSYGQNKRTRATHAARALEAGAALHSLSHKSGHTHNHRLRHAQHRSTPCSSELQLDSLCAGLTSVIYVTECACEFESLGFEIVRIKDQKEGKLQPKWAVLRHAGLGLVVVVFRGTYSYQDVLADMMFKPVVLPCGVPVNGGMQVCYMYIHICMCV